MTELVTSGAPPRVVIASDEPYPPALITLESYGVDPEWLHTPPERPMAYWQGLAHHWALAESFILVEHDILPWYGALEELWTCSCIYGGFGYMMGGGFDTVAFGCTKFTRPLMEAVPGAFTEAPFDDPAQRRAWYNLDSNFAVAMRRHGQAPHLHGPPVIHLNTKHQDPSRKDAVRPDRWATMRQPDTQGVHR